MDSSPRRWVLHPLSPRLDHSDLRTLLVSPGLQQGPLVPESGDALVQARQVALSQGEDPGQEFSVTSSPGSPSSSSSGSHCGFYSFVDDGSLEAELNEAWMLSPRRLTQLATLREGKGFRLQTYSSDRKPSSLFQEEQSLYQVEPGEHAVKEHEGQELRMEIIRAQAPKNSPTLKKKQWSSLDDVQPSRSTAKLLEGFSLSFESCISNPEGSTPDTSGSIDRQQIHFSTARQQFQKMEQDRLNVLLTVPRSPQNTALHPARPPSSPLQKQGSAASMQQQDVPDPLSALGPPHLSTTAQDPAQHPALGPPHLSTVPQDPASDYSSDGSTSNDSPDERTQARNLSLETPIEREMRLAQEREENLRRLRGLKPSRVEMVEIKSKSLFSQLSSSVLKGKERNPVSFLIQREIQRDTQRGGGSQQNNPYLNPNPEEGKPAPSQQGASLREPERGRTLEKHNGAGDGEGEREKGPVFPPSCCPHRNTPAHHKVLPPGFLEDPTPPEPLAHGGTGGSVILKSSNGQGAGRSLAVSVVQTPLSAALPSWTEMLGSGRAGVSDVIQKDIEENLRREEELREQRGSIEGIILSSVSLEPRSTASQLDQPCFHFSPLLPPPWSPVALHTTTTLPPPTPTLHPPTLRPPSGLTAMLLEDLEESRLKQRLEESSYAGIKPVDYINNEVVEATRVTRHKNHMALQWEAGIFNNQLD